MYLSRLLLGDAITLFCSLEHLDTWPIVLMFTFNNNNDIMANFPFRSKAYGGKKPPPPTDSLYVFK